MLKEFDPQQDNDRSHDRDGNEYPNQEGADFKKAKHPIRHKDQLLQAANVFYR